MDVFRAASSVIITFEGGKQQEFISVYRISFFLISGCAIHLNGLYLFLSFSHSSGAVGARFHIQSPALRHC